MNALMGKRRGRKQRTHKRSVAEQADAGQEPQQQSPPSAPDEGAYMDPGQMDPAMFSDPTLASRAAQAMMGALMGVDPNVPAWGKEPWKSALPEIMKAIAKGAQHAGQPADVLIVAYMPDGNIHLKMGSRETMPLVDEWKDTALAIRAFGKDGKLLSERYAPELLVASVPDWLRG